MSSIKLFNIGQLATYNSEESKMLKKENMEIVIEDGKILKVGTNLNNADVISLFHSDTIIPKLKP